MIKAKANVGMNKAKIATSVKTKLSENAGVTIGCSLNF